MVAKMGNSTVSAVISNVEKRKSEKNYRKQSDAIYIPFRPMEKIRKNGKNRMQNWGGKKNELSRHIELSWGFGGLREKLGNSEEDKIWKVDGETRKQEIVGNQLPTIQEGEVEMISGR